jgi:nitrite reductase/ring-hydroxylating ferredoxin subunit
MKRKEFINACSKSCLFMLGGGITFLQSCMGSHYIAAQLSGSDLIIPLSSFQIEKEGSTSFRKYVITYHERLQYPICIYRLSATDYQALLMKCTHQGTELQVFGDRLQCPAHGSEFAISGTVKNGPAESALRIFPVRIEDEILKINLA